MTCNEKHKPAKAELHNFFNQRRVNPLLKILNPNAVVCVISHVKGIFRHTLCTYISRQWLPKLQVHTLLTDKSEHITLSLMLQSFNPNYTCERCLTSKLKGTAYTESIKNEAYFSNQISHRESKFNIYIV